jgi:putative nucleotidyltransferase with HDIG domain
MANSFFSWLGRLFGGGSKTPAPSTPAPASTSVAAPPPAKVEAPKEKTKPKADEKSDHPEVALKQMLQVQILPSGPLKPASPEVRERTLAGLKKLDEIPALKSLAAGFSRTMTRPDVSVEEVVASISKDQSLAARILRMANSTEVSSEQRIDSLDVAVQMLGVERVRKAADAVFILSTANNVGDGLDWKHLWVHALGTAAIAEKLEKIVRGKDASTVYVAGLLHDVGKIVLSTLSPEDYKIILVAAWNEKDRLETLELSRLGVDHGEAGVAFARQNKMGEIVVQSIAHHAHPEKAESHRFEVAVVSIANYLAKAYGLGFSGSRLDDSDGEFEDLPAWTVIAEETGMKPDVTGIEEQMQVFVKKLRSELAALREGL